MMSVSGFNNVNTTRHWASEHLAHVDRWTRYFRLWGAQHRDHVVA